MGSNFNMMQLLQMLKTGNPQQTILNMLQQSGNDNPLFANLLSLAQQGKGQEIEAIARNVLKEQGRDFDTEFNSFRRTMGL